MSARAVPSGRTICQSALAPGRRLPFSSGPAIDHQGALGSILLNLTTRDVFFIDEIHRLNTVVEESLYPALEDFRFDAVLGKGVGASAATLPLKPSR